MKTIITLDRANQPYGFPQLNASGNFNNIIVESGLTANTLSVTNLTSGFLPYNSGGTFANSILFQTGNTIALGTTSDTVGGYAGDIVIQGDTSGVGAGRIIVGGTGNFQDLIFTKTNASGEQKAWSFGNRYDNFFGNTSGSFQIVGVAADDTFRVPLIAQPNGDLILVGASSNATNGNVGIGVLSPSNKLHISASTNPVRILGLTANTSDLNVLSVDGTGVVHTYPISGLTGSSSTSGAYLPLSGGTVTGGTIFNSGLTANTISATTYYNLPTDVYVTGGTYTNGNAIFTNNTGGTFNVSGFAIGGGGGQIFYLNLSQSQNGNRLLSTTASTASEQTSGVTIGNGVTSSIASFQTTPLNISLIPGGIWSFYLHSYKENSNASFNIFVEVYKITSGGSQTLLFATDPTSVTTNSPNPSMQLTDGYFSGTPLNVSDGVVAVVKATNTGNQSHSITLVTEGSAHYSYVVSTIPTQQGLTCDTLSGCSIIQTIQTDVSNKLDKSGGTVNGNTVFQSGLTATTISATTYYGVNAVTGGTYNGTTGVITLSGTGSVNGNQITGFSTGGGGGGLTWNNATTTQSASVDNGYVGTATTLTTITLPSTAAFGTIVEVVGTGTGLWRISQNSGQSIKFGIATTATGTGGYLSATSQYDCVKLLCTSTDTTFVVTSAIGNIFFI